MFFFFFKQKTAYEMRISDWSSDVGSSDLRRALGLEQATQVDEQRDRLAIRLGHVAFAVAEPGAPVGGGAPGRAFQDEAAVAVAGNRGMAAVIAAQCRLAGLILQQVKGREVGQIESFVEDQRSEEHTSELQSLMRISYAVFCLKKK